MLKVECYENKECEFIRQLNQIGHHSFPYSVTTPSSIPLFGNLTRLHRETPHPLFGKHPFPYSTNTPSPIRQAPLPLCQQPPLPLFGNHPFPIRHKHPFPYSAFTPSPTIRHSPTRSGNLPFR